MQKLKPIFVSFFLVAACLAGASAKDEQIHADGSGANYVIPKNSPVQFLSANEYGTEIKFKGQFVLTGAYRYVPGKSGDEPDLSFLPDKNITATLPYWRGHGLVDEIRFSNAEKFVATVVPAAEIKKLKSKSGNSLSGKASVLVDGYEASIDCDVPSYSVNFISVINLPGLVARSSFTGSEGC